MSVLRHLGKQVCCMPKRIPASTCCYSASSHDNSKSNIGFSKDGSMIVCWHPEPEFPYEHTKPLPRNLPELQQGDSALKIQLLQDHENRHEDLSIKRLTEMFHTNKHIWYSRKKRRCPEYLQHFTKDRDAI